RVRVHHAGLEQDGCESIGAKMLVQRSEITDLDDAVDEQIVGESLCLFALQFAFEEVAACGGGDERRSLGAVREQIVFLADAVAFAVVAFRADLDLPEHGGTLRVTNAARSRSRIVRENSRERGRSGADRW